MSASRVMLRDVEVGRVHAVTDARPEPSPTRAVAAVWDEGDAEATGRFTWPQGIVLGLMLAVDVQFGVAIARGFDVFLWILVPYAVGLTLGVALLQPRVGCETAFGFALIPLGVQLLLFFDFWSREAGLYGGDVSLYSPDFGYVMAAGLAWFLGGLFTLTLLPFSRRSSLLVIVETAPLLVFFLLPHLSA